MECDGRGGGEVGWERGRDMVGGGGLGLRVWKL